MSKTKIPPLPLIMVAPNGARRTKADHPALPVTISETVAAARACFDAGAGCLHAHVRDAAGAHVLDAGLYRELLSTMRTSVPNMQVQITSEAVGRYNPAEQRALVRDVRPEFVSIALREMVSGEDTADAGVFYRWALNEDITVQHILYAPGDLEQFYRYAASGVIPGECHQVLFVLGRYAENQESTPEDLDPFLKVLSEHRGDTELDWAVCAFGHRETDCLVHAVAQGGKTRIGFENSLWNRDGSLAIDNAARVRDLKKALKAEGLA